jgi:hypothetical protein
MRRGDLVRLINLRGWGGVGLVMRVSRTSYGTGQIYLLVGGKTATIPWHARKTYISEVISESR